jgi:fluoride exporter
MLNYFWIGVGSALGGMARQWCSVMSARLWPVEFPWGTIAINVAGSFIIGAFATLSEPGGRWPLSLAARQFVMVGLCGGYTTFSSFSLQTVIMMRDGNYLGASVNVIASVLLCLTAVIAGHIAAAAFAG